MRNAIAKNMTATNNSGQNIIIANEGSSLSSCNIAPTIRPPMMYKSDSNKIPTATIIPPKVLC